MALVGALCVVVTQGAIAGNEIITVTTLNDTFDINEPKQIAELPGPDGLVSFREAVEVANNTAGPQTIEFAIPQSEWWLGGDQAVLRLEDGAFLITDDETTVDFTSQTDFTGDTNPSGWEVGIYGLQPNAWGVAAIYVFADNCVIKGLDRVLQRGYGVQIVGNYNRVISCTISGPLYAAVKVQGDIGSPATGNVIGGTKPGEGNVLSAGNSGVRIDGPTDDTVVIGNTLVGSSFAGVEVRGAYCCPDYTPYNTRIGGPTPAERNWIADNGKYGEEGFPLGEQVDIEWAVGTTVEGNYIGTTEAGDARFPGAHGTAGVAVRESEATIIRNNVVAGIRKEGVNHYDGDVFGVGIVLYGEGHDATITGNHVGVGADGVTAIPNRSGIEVGWFQGTPTNATIGGTATGEANIIAYNEGNGILLDHEAVEFSIRGNSIHSNAGLGIDLTTPLGGFGVTPNDPGDADEGANDLQNFPEISEATTNGSSVQVKGTLESTPDSPFHIDFYANDECDATGNGEGQTYIGSIDVVTDAAGTAMIDAALPVSVEPASGVTATATNSLTRNTSEFSSCILMGTTSATGDVTGDGVVNLLDLLALLDAWGTCGVDCTADLDGDGIVNLFDLLMLLDHWSS